MECHERRTDIERLQRWCEGKPVVLGLFATQVAMTFEPTYELVRMCRSETGLFASLRPGRRNDRLTCYGNHRGMRAQLLRSLKASDTEIDGCECVLDDLTWLSRTDKTVVMNELKALTPDDWKIALSAGSAMWKDISGEHWRNLHGEQQDEMTDVEWQKFCAVPACQHFFRVAFPCWILYGKWPSQMLRMASSGGSGNLAALRDLIQLDNEVIHHPRLHDVLHPKQAQLRDSRRELLASALRSPPPEISRVRLKYRLARLIFDVAQRLCHPLKTPEINELFAIAARVDAPHCKASTRAMQPGSFLKGVDREKGHWNLGPKPDKKTFKAVRALYR